MVGLLLATVGSPLAPSLALAADPAPTPAPAETGSEAEASSDAGSTRWGPILGACMGVLFGGVLAVWQLRGMKRDR